LKVGDENFDRAIRSQAANLADGFSKDPGTANVVIIAIDAGDDGELESELSNGFSNAARFVEIDCFGTPLGHSAEAASSGADVSEKHEGRGAMVPALADIGTLGGFADGVQVETARQLLQLMVLLAHGSLGAKPGRLGSACSRNSLDLDKLGGRHWC